MLVKGLNVPTSITAAHFQDLPRGHPVFKSLETIYDLSTQAPVPFLDYKKGGKGNDTKALVHPDEAITGEEAARIAAGVTRKKTPTPRADAHLTRAEAARFIAEIMKGHP
jgi:hypothetical protein